MIKLCTCGKVKTAAPFRAAITVKWLCDDCRLKLQAPHNKRKKTLAELLKECPEESPPPRHSGPRR